MAISTVAAVEKDFDAQDVEMHDTVALLVQKHTWPACHSWHWHTGGGASC